MGEGVVIDGAPIAVHEGRDEEQQGALRLVEVGDHHPHDVVFVARGYDNLCTGMQGFQAVAVQVVCYGLQGCDGIYVRLIG